MEDLTSGALRRERLRRAALYLVIEANLESVVTAALDGGVHIVQLRDKSLADDRLMEAGRRLRVLCDRHDALLIVNDRLDLALACDADGVHVGQDDQAVGAVRCALGPELLIGISTHSPEQVEAAERSEADYLGVGPVFETATKPGVAPVGGALVHYAAEHVSKPFFAIGGIDTANAREVAAAGARRIAVVRAIRDAGDPRAAASALREAVEAREAPADVAG